MSGKRILLIDDDADLSYIIADMLESYGYVVTCAADSEAALELLSDNVYHLIVLDINLPGMTGFELCRELRRLSTVPVLFAGARGRLPPKAVLHERTAFQSKCADPPRIWF